MSATERLQSYSVHTEGCGTSLTFCNVRLTSGAFWSYARQGTMRCKIPLAYFPQRYIQIMNRINLESASATARNKHPVSVLEFYMKDLALQQAHRTLQKTQLVSHKHVYVTFRYWVHHRQSKVTNSLGPTLAYFCAFPNISEHIFVLFPTLLMITFGLLLLPLSTFGFPSLVPHFLSLFAFTLSLSFFHAVSAILDRGSPTIMGRHGSSWPCGSSLPNFDLILIFVATIV